MISNDISNIGKWVISPHSKTPYILKEDEFNSMLSNGDMDLEMYNLWKPEDGDVCILDHLDDKLFITSDWKSLDNGRYIVMDKYICFKISPVIFNLGDYRI